MPQVYTRKKNRKKFDYFLGEVRVTDQEVIDRINSLVIPPAWKDVQIAKIKSAKVQATGKDSAGRTQAIYHPTFRATQEQKKFARLVEFGKKLPGLRAQVQKDMAKQSLSKEKVLATIVRLMDEAYFRVGNESYARDHQSYGVTTLRRKHTNIRTTTVTFDFIGKSGKRQQKTIKDRRFVRIMKQLDELPGHEVFQYLDHEGKKHSITSNDVNLYIKEHTGGDFTAKDFRTWGGTLIATSTLALAKETTKKGREKAIVQCVKEVAKHLGNTPAVARSSYIDPRILNTYLKTDVLAGFNNAVAHMKADPHFKPAEKAMLNVLKQAKK